MAKKAGGKGLGFMKLAMEEVMHPEAAAVAERTKEMVVPVEKRVRNTIVQCAEEIIALAEGRASPRDTTKDRQEIMYEAAFIMVRAIGLVQD